MKFHCTIENPGVASRDYIIEARDGEEAFRQALDDSIKQYGVFGRVKTLHEAEIVADVESSRLVDQAFTIFRRDIAALRASVENKGFPSPDINILFYPDRIVIRISVENSETGKKQRPLHEHGGRTAWAWYRGASYDEALAAAKEAIARMEEDIGLACARWFE